jgi:hypothetical protein
MTFQIHNAEGKYEYLQHRNYSNPVEIITARQEVSSLYKKRAETFPKITKALNKQAEKERQAKLKDINIWNL